MENTEKGIQKRINRHLKDFERKSYANMDTKKIRRQSLDEKKLVNCSLGENPFGFSQRVKQALKQIKDSNIMEYPKPHDYFIFKEKIAEYWKDIAEVKYIFLGAGSIYVLERINLLFLSKGKIVLGYSPQFTEYSIETRILGASYKSLFLSREMNFKFDKDRFLRKLNGSIDLVYLDNPNNPTGQIIPIKDIEEIVIEANEKEVIVLVDEAYGEFMSKRNSAISLTGVYDNLIVLRSFSKGFGLPGLRVGYAICRNKLGKFLQKVEVPFSVNSVAVLVAQRALEDVEFLDKCIKKIKTSKNKLLKRFKQENYIVAETALEVPIFVVGRDENIDLYEAFAKNNIIVTPGHYFDGLGNNYARLRIPKDFEMLLRKIPKFLSGKKIF